MKYRATPIVTALLILLMGLILLLSCDNDSDNSSSITGIDEKLDRLEKEIGNLRHEVNTVIAEQQQGDAAPPLGRGLGEAKRIPLKKTIC